MHIRELQRVVRQLGRPIRRISRVGYAPVRIVLSDLSPAWVGCPHLHRGLIHTGLGTKHGVGLPLAIGPCLGVDAYWSRWRTSIERNGGVERVGRDPAMVEGRDEGIASKRDGRGGARLHYMGHDCTKEWVDMRGGRWERM